MCARATYPVAHDADDDDEETINIINRLPICDTPTRALELLSFVALDDDVDCEQYVKFN